MRLAPPSTYLRRAGQPAGVGCGQERAGESDVHDVDQLADRRALRRFVQHQFEILEARAARVLSGPGEIACTRMP